MSDFCLNCGTSERKHKARGLCEICYGSQKTSVLCTCGCGLTVPKIGNKIRKYRKGHWMRGNARFMEAHIKAFLGENNPWYGKFGKEHPAYGHETKPEVREQRRANRIKAMAESRGRITGIEKILSAILDDIGIEHIPQKEMYKKFVVDEFLPNSNVVIEAYGKFWHGDPRFYDEDHLNPLQKKNLVRDDSKCAYLNKCGHRVLILWENELNNSVEWCANEILLAIKNQRVPKTQDSIYIKSFASLHPKRFLDLG